MNSLLVNALKLARRLYFRRRKLAHVPHVSLPWDSEAVSKPINALLASGQPCMVARLGSVELEAIACYLAHRDGFSVTGYIKGVNDYDRWDLDIIHWLCVHTGFFPEDQELAAHFCELMMECASSVDVLGSWLKYEALMFKEHDVVKVPLAALEPYNDSLEPWTVHLAGKRVLVVHPFEESIVHQYKHKRELLFKDPRILPPFELKTLRAVQSIGGLGAGSYSTWFDALESMKEAIDHSDYDICLLGCGSYGFPLASYVKSRGKQAIHMGGALQLLFGIKGKRWTQHYGSAESNPYYQLFNEHWIYPSSAETPAHAHLVESACYWE